MYELTPRQFNNYATGSLDARDRELKQSWEQVRWVSYYAAIGHLKKGTKKDQLISYPWDGENLEVESDGVKMPTEKEIQESKEYWAKIDRKRNGETDN